MQKSLILIRLSAVMLIVGTANELPGQMPPPHKSPAVAGLLGLTLAGSGHWYAEERGRALLVALPYWIGVSIVAGGRTDNVGKVGGVLAAGSLVFSIIDGIKAAKRFNARAASQERQLRRASALPIPYGVVQQSSTR